ncbi:MAG: hypothetical protein KUF75_13235 [Candidatus Thiodiazotropha sp. (ex Ctena orbiculata)]|nr:hypothetical protein [Candidatus Thiodiazotropha taylori]
MEVKIVRPRGFIIAGKRQSFKVDNEEEVFRILNDSFKNIDIILFLMIYLII